MPLSSFACKKYCHKSPETYKKDDTGHEKMRELLNLELSLAVLTECGKVVEEIKLHGSAKTHVQKEDRSYVKENWKK